MPCLMPLPLLTLLLLLPGFPLPCRAGTLGAEYRSLDGSGNHRRNAGWGVGGAAFLRSPPYRPRYGADNGSLVAGLPNPRLVSNALDAVSRKQLNTRLVNDMHTTWGVFITHDMSSTSGGSEPAPIPVPPCDPYFDPDCTGNVSLPFTRSRYVMQGGTRQQLNDASSFIDGAMIYGADPSRAAAVRSFAAGKLLVNEAGEPPPVSATTNVFMANPVRRNSSQLRLVGDPRSNISPQLLALHAVFSREHNRYCDALKAANPSWSDETLYQESRRRVIAHIQRITYTEYLPALLGGPLPLYAGYNESVDPTLANFFSTCALRYGHPELTSVIMRLTSTGVSTLGGPLLLRDVYFNPQLGLSEGVEPLLRGMLFSGQWRVEPDYNADVRNHLFENPGRARPMDLMALNIQRGRDHGLPGYNAARVAYGMDPVVSFDAISSRPALGAVLQQLYASVDDIDPIVGAQAEDEVSGNLGLLAASAVTDQFQRIRDGDRLWWENGQFDVVEEQAIRDTTLTDIINRNTNLNYSYDHAFFRQDASLDSFSATMPYIPALGAEYPNLKELDRGYRLYWDVDAANGVVRFAAQAHGQGWVGLGFAQYDAKQPLHSYMYHVDMVIGRLVGGIPLLDDRFSFEIGQPSRDVDLGCTDDLSATSFEVYDTYRVMKFTRPMVTPDSQQARGRLQDSPDVVKSAEVVRCDTALVAGTDYFITYAANPSQDQLLYHGAARGAARVTLIPAPAAPAAGAGGMGMGVAVGLGVGLGLLVFVLVAGGLFLARRHGGKDNQHAPREAPLCLLFTDIEQSTMLWSLNQTVMARMIELHTAVIRRVIAQHHAFEVKTIGDSFMVAVKDVRAAVSIAMDIQLQLLRAPWDDDMLALVAEAFPGEDHRPPAGRLGFLPASHGSPPPATPTAAGCWHGPRVRIGAHFAAVGSGVIVEKDRVSGSYDYFGNPVNVAARVESLAYGGQVLVSGTLMEAYPELRSDPDLLVQALGHVKVKGVPVPVEVYQVAPIELAGRVFPPLQVLGHSPAPDAYPEKLSPSRGSLLEMDLPGSLGSATEVEVLSAAGNRVGRI